MSRTPVDPDAREPRRPVEVEGQESRRPVDVEDQVPRRPVDVAVGVLIDREGRFLVTSRPEGKVYAGYWEFPGGKLEAGESVEEALRRELHEELGIRIGAVHPWKIEMMDYPHARVRLHFCKVFDWSGEFEMRERQSMAWQTLPVEVAPVLPGTVPVLEWFAVERGFVGATHSGA
jgi:8-oxo-dGTP diphosphatase